MPKATSLSFVTEIPIKISSKEQAILKKRFFVAKQQYNALLGEALKRLSNMRSDVRFKQAKELYKTKGKKAEGKAIFKQLAEDYRYGKYDLQPYCKQWNRKNNSLSIGSALSQKLSHRAFQAVDEYKKGVGGKPRFKGYRGLNSIEDKQLTTLRLKEYTIYYKGLVLPLKYNLKDPTHYHGLNSRIKYIRLVKRSFNGRIRYFAQLICEGSPWIKSKNVAGESTVGLDIGPQTIAIVSSEKQEAHLKVFADELKPLKQKKKKTSAKDSKTIKKQQPNLFSAR